MPTALGQDTLPHLVSWVRRNSHHLCLSSPSSDPCEPSSLSSATGSSAEDLVLTGNCPHFSAFWFLPRCPLLGHSSTHFCGNSVLHLPPVSSLTASLIMNLPPLGLFSAWPCYPGLCCLPDSMSSTKAALCTCLSAQAWEPACCQPGLVLPSA